MEPQSYIRDISKFYVERHPELQFCEMLLPYKEFYYHSQEREKIVEFKIIKKITETKKHAEMLLENVGDRLSRNRYADILPYKDTIILPISGDYINASMIDGAGSTDRGMFIATQGPTQATSNTFWQLVWDYNVPLIIMSCCITENETEKCFQYFPLDDRLITEDFEVSLVKGSKKFANLHERVLMICHKPTENYRIVVHLQFVGWPDLSVPSVVSEFYSISYMVEKIEKKWRQYRGKILVHCSAGVGRTGAIIAVYNMISDVKTEKQVSVFRTVRLLREQRWGMVANEEQYSFIYEYMEHWISSYLLAN